MDELHDAIQDAQYIGAVTNAHRGPSAAFYNPSHTELAQFIEKQERALGTDWLDLENILDQPLGFYFMRRFCEAEQHGVKKLDFLIELTKFRSLTEADQRVAKAKEIWESFCADTRSPSSTNHHHHHHHHHSAHHHATASSATTNANVSLNATAATVAGVQLSGSGPLPTSLVTPTASSSTTTDHHLMMNTTNTPNDLASASALSSSRGGTSHRVGSIIQDMNVASYTNNGVIFWRKGLSTVKMADVTEIYKDAASETSPIGVGGDVIKRIGNFLRRRGSASSASSGKTPRASENASTLIPGEVNVSSASPTNSQSRAADLLQKQSSVGASSPLTTTSTSTSTSTTTPNSPSSTTSPTSSTKPAPLVMPPVVTVYNDLKTCPLTLFDELEACVLCSIDQVHLKDFRSSVFHRRLISFLFLQTRKVAEDDFTVLRVLGRGGFGMVNGCIKRTSASLYAMKVMNKKMIKKKHAEKLCLAERKILAMISSPFVVCLKYAFQTPEELFLVLDLRTGGDLSFHLNRCRFTETQVRFWAAQILLGLQHLHEKNIVYRDLKPENILLDERGNCSISDLGLAVEVTPNLAGRCGTRGYWAPEMLLRDENGQRMTYNHVVDWWSYGCLVYELLYGKCPFRTSKAKALHEDKQQAYDKATLELTPSYDPKYFSPEATELIQQLLIRDPKKRLGANGAEEVKRMKFFDPIDWHKIETMSMPPPFVPDNEINAASQADIGSFDVSVVKGVKLSEQDQSAYGNWDYVCPETFQREAIEYLEWEIKHGPCTISPNSNSCCSLL